MGDEPVTQRRVEIVHESLLREWPRLVRWQTQDLDGAQLRDQLRQAAQLWEERGRLDDLLWTGTAFREFTLWRERYPGGLTEGEEGFATAMTRKALRLRRRRRLAVSLLVAALLVVLVVVTASRQQAVTAREEAEEAASRAEAQKLLALGQLELESSPTLALAHATKSLELADTPEARRFVLRALAAGPPATILPIEDWSAWNLSFSPDGTWAAFGGRASLRAISQDGTRRTLIEPFEMLDEVRSAFDLSGQHLMSANGRQLGVWSVPGFELIEEQEVPLNAIRILPTPDGPIVLSVERLDSATIGAAPTRLGTRLETSVAWRSPPARGPADSISISIAPRGGSPTLRARTSTSAPLTTGVCRRAASDPTPLRSGTSCSIRRPLGSPPTTTVTRRSGSGRCGPG